MSPASRIWIAAPTRFSGLSRAAAWAALGFFALLLVLSLSALAHHGPAAISHEPSKAAENRADILLYEKIVDGVRHGGGYYHVAANALRAGHYPLRPFVTMREPTLAEMQAHLPQPLIMILLYLLVAGTLVLWSIRLGRAVTRIAPLAIAMALLAAGLMAFVERDLWSLHEVWAGLLVALSLGLRRPDRWAASAALGLAAMLVRETAALYVVIMGATAFAEGRMREGIGWCIALALFAAALAAHAFAVHQVTTASDLASPGWSGMQGFGFFVLAMIMTTALHVLPVWIGALLCALSLFGWLSWRDPLGARVAAILVVCGLLLSCFARVDNFYWALLVAPTAFVGLIFLPDAMCDLFHAALDNKRSAVTG